MGFGKDIHGVQRKNPHDFSSRATMQEADIWVKYSDNHRMDWL